MAAASTSCLSRGSPICVACGRNFQKKPSDSHPVPATQLAFQRMGYSVADAYRKALATTGKVVARRSIDRVSALGKELVVLLINLEFEGRKIQLFGSCRTGDDVLSATARAALDATNRYIEIVNNREGA